MNSWRSRFLLAALMLVAMRLHAWALASVPNTDEGMALFHGSAAAVDYLILWCAPRFVSGTVCDDTQNLCLVSVIANYVGWLAYTAYAPPIYYDACMWGLSYAQFGRLLLVDRHADAAGFDLVRGVGGGRHQENFGATYS